MITVGVAVMIPLGVIKYTDDALMWNFLIVARLNCQSGRSR
jgi:hypothetical protein